MTLFLPATVPARDRNGVVAPSAVWSFYSEDSTTPLATDEGDTSVTATSAGEFAFIPLTDGTDYRAILRDSEGRKLVELLSTASTLFSPGAQQALSSGVLVPGAYWRFYTTSTTTPQSVYSDDTLTVSLGSAVQADSTGVFPEIHLDSGVTYKAVLETPDGTEIDSIDPVTTNSMASYLDTDVGEALTALDRARIFADYSKKNTAGTVVKNLNAPTPTANLVPFPTGGIVNEVPNASIVLTNYSEDIDDAGGTANATLIVTTGTNRSLYIARPSSFTPALGNGTISVRFRMRSKAGKGSQTFDTLFLGTNSLGQTVTETPANFEYELTYAGSGDIIVRFPTGDTRVLIDRLQVYEGALADMPDWADEVHGGVRKAIAHASNLTTDANGAVDTESDTSGLIAIDPAFPAKHTYSELTVIEVRSVKASTTAGHMVNLSKQDGGATTNIPLYVDGGTGYEGEINSTLEGNTRSQMAASLTGQGVFVSGVRIDATERSAIIHGAPLAQAAVTWAGYQTNRFMLGSFSNTAVADQRANTALGKHVFTVIWDEALTDSEITSVSKYLHTLATQRGNTMAEIAVPLVISGDSNSTRDIGDWTQRVAVDGYFSPGANLVCAINSVGGQGLADLEHDDSGAESALADGVITANGRFYKKDLPTLLAWAKMGAKPGYNPCVSTNDSPRIESGGVSQYNTDFGALMDLALAAHDDISILYESPKPQDTTRSGWNDWETNRATIRTWQLARESANPTREFVNDVGGSASIGSYALLESGSGGPHYLSDRIHLDNAAAPDGDAEYGVLFKADYEALRTAKGF